MAQAAYTPLGIRALLLTPFQPEVEFYYSNSSRDEVSTLGLSVAGALLLRAGRTPGSLTQAGQLTGQGGTTQQKISFAGPDSTGQLVGRCLDLAYAGPVHALAQDLLGRWWWCGAELGLSLEVTATPGVELSLALAGTGSQPAQRIAAALLPGFLALIS